MAKISDKIHKRVAHLNDLYIQSYIFEAYFAYTTQGSVWQEDWFDRWMRHEDELNKTIDYIRNNPVKAKIVSEWHDYRWRISSQADA